MARPIRRTQVVPLDVPAIVTPRPLNLPIRHGTFTKGIIAKFGKYQESESDWVVLYEGLFYDLQPIGDAEILLVEQVAKCYWRMMRVHRWEIGFMAREWEKLEGLPEKTRAALNAPSASDMDKLRRYESHLQRTIEKNLRLLREMQKSRLPSNTIELGDLNKEIRDAKNDKHDESEGGT